MRAETVEVGEEGLLRTWTLRDHQQKKCYEWEKRLDKRYPEFLGSKSEVRAIARRAAAMFGLPAVKIEFKRAGSFFSHYFPDKKIRFAIHSEAMIGVRTYVVLHEVAHYIFYSIFPTFCISDYAKEFSAHGKVFVGICMTLYEKFGLYERDEMVRLANKMGVDFLAHVTNKRLRDYCDRAIDLGRRPWINS